MRNVSQSSPKASAGILPAHAHRRSDGSCNERRQRGAQLPRARNHVPERYAHDIPHGPGDHAFHRSAAHIARIDTVAAHLICSVPSRSHCSQEIRGASGTIHKLTRGAENLSGIRVVKAYVREAYGNRFVRFELGSEEEPRSGTGAIDHVAGHVLLVGFRLYHLPTADSVIDGRLTLGALRHCSDISSC